MGQNLDSMRQGQQQPQQQKQQQQRQRLERSKAELLYELVVTNGNLTAIKALFQAGASLEVNIKYLFDTQLDFYETAKLEQYIHF